MGGEPETVLVVDDDPAIGKVLGALLRQTGLESVVAEDGVQALGILESRHVDAVVTDLQMPRMDGMELLRRVAERWHDTPVIVLTAHGTVPLAVEAMRAGAADFFLKPFDRDEVLYSVRKVLTAARFAAERPARAPTLAGGMIGGSPPMRELAALIERAATVQTSVLLRGESGTGKELAARAIHEQSTRAKGPFVVVNCAALPENLLEAELFGHEKGAFTGAVARKPGRAELADGGTLFLDEVGDAPLAMQAKLLRLIQEREFTPLGATRVKKTDVRFVAATHRDLEARVGSGEFREDLFYRLNVLPLWLPPLRERAGDLALLAQHFCAQHAADNGLSERTLDDEALALLDERPWPGNVRELQNFVERLVILSDGPVIGATDLRRELGRMMTPAGGTLRVAGAAVDAETLETSRLAAEREALATALARSKNNRTQAARVLGVSRRTLYNKLAQHDLI